MPYRINPCLSAAEVNALTTSIANLQANYDRGIVDCLVDGQKVTFASLSDLANAIAGKKNRLYQNFRPRALNIDLSRGP